MAALIAVLALAVVMPVANAKHIGLTVLEPQAGAPSQAIGTASVKVEDGKASFSITVHGLSGPVTAAHFHGPAAAGVDNNNNVIAIPTLVGSTHTTAEVEGLSEDTIADFKANLYYLNVHTKRNPLGEVRGQLEFGNVGFAALSSNKTIPLVAGTATGSFASKFVGTGQALWYTITVSGVTGRPTAAHLHGPAGPLETAGVFHTIEKLAGNYHATGLWTGLTAADKTAILNEQVYVNVHTKANPAGEVRGQVEGLIAPPAKTFGAAVLKRQQTAAATAGSGAARKVTCPVSASIVGGLAAVEVNEDEQTMKYSVSVFGLSSDITSAVFQFGNGNNAATITIDGLLGNATNAQATVDVSAAQMNQLKSQDVHCIVNTQQMPNGEVKGTIEVALAAGVLKGAASVPPVETAATGTFYARLVSDGQELEYVLLVQGMEATAAHFHHGYALSTGPVLQTMPIASAGVASTRWRIRNNDHLRALLSEEVYVNVHSEAHPNGEIRTQVVGLLPPAEQSHGHAVLKPKASDSPANPAAAGTAAITWNHDTNTLHYTIAVSEITSVTVARILSGNKTLVEISNIAGELSATGSVTDLSPDDVTQLFKSSTLVAVEGTDGTLQGPLRFAAVALASLTGAAEVPPVNSQGAGVFALEFLDQTTVRWSATVVLPGASLTGAHLHASATPTETSGVIQILNGLKGSTHHATGTWTLCQKQIDAIVANRAYVNVHTDDNPNGELRGQVTGVSFTDVATAAVASSGGGTGGNTTGTVVGVLFAVVVVVLAAVFIIRRRRTPSQRHTLSSPDKGDTELMVAGPAANKYGARKPAPPRPGPPPKRPPPPPVARDGPAAASVPKRIPPPVHRPTRSASVTRPSIPPVAVAADPYVQEQDEYAGQYYHGHPGHGNEEVDPWEQPQENEYDTHDQQQGYEYDTHDQQQGYEYDTHDQQQYYDAPGADDGEQGWATQEEPVQALPVPAQRPRPVSRPATKPKPAIKPKPRAAPPAAPRPRPRPRPQPRAAVVLTPAGADWEEPAFNSSEA